MTTKGDSLQYKVEQGLLILARLVVGIVFVWASIDKIQHPEQFARAVANYRMLPEFLVNVFAVILPWVELWCGSLLILGQWQRSASLVLSAMLVVFVVAVGSSLLRGLDIHCGCFNTASGRKVGMVLFLEDLLLLGTTLFLLIRSGDALGWKPFIGGR